MVGQTTARRLLIDDLDRYDEKFRKMLFPAVVEGKHRIAAVVRSPFDGRIAKTWRAQLAEPCFVQLDALSERAEDLTVFLSHWARQNGLALPVSARCDETVRLLLRMDLPRGFGDVVRLLTEIVARGEPFWDPPDAIVWLTAYRRAVVGQRSDRPVVLVEGRTDAIYFEWVSQLCAGPSSGDVDVEPCNSAKKIPPKAIAYRNEGRKAVALFDNDVVGREQHRQMRDYEIRSVLIPERFDQLAGCVRDHVLAVVEIEDLLPVSAVERFLQEKGREPELVITAPRQRRKRVVVHSDDKLELAEWVRANLGSESARGVVEVFNELRSSLELAPLALPKPT
jgi:hypothetical protein